MYALMINGKIQHMTNNAGIAATHLGTAVAVLYPKADWKRAALLFKSGTPVTIGNISGICN